MILYSRSVYLPWFLFQLQLMLWLWYCIEFFWLTWLWLRVVTSSNFGFFSLQSVMMKRKTCYELSWDEKSTFWSHRFRWNYFLSWNVCLCGQNELIIISQTVDIDIKWCLVNWELQLVVVSVHYIVFLHKHCLKLQLSW